MTTNAEDLNMKSFTGIRLVRKHGLESYQVVIRNVLAHEFMSEQAAQQKLNWYCQQLNKAA